MKGLLSLAVSLASVSASPVLLDSSIHRDAAPILSASNAQEIADNYIVLFKKHVTEKHAASHHSWVQDIHLNVQTRKMDLRKRSQTPMVDDIFSGLKHTYNIAGSLLGYSGHFDEDVIEQIRRHPDVELIERDQEVHTLGSPDSAIEKNAPWGLARISHRGSLSFGNFNKYLYANGSGEGVDVYIIDTGTNIAHVDFEGRASWGKTIPQGDPDEDGNGHGTHCSGTVAGKKYGVAKKAHIKAVKVLRSNGSGSMSDVVKGVEYAAESHLEQVSAAKEGKNKKFKGSAANMSLGGGKSAILDQAVNAAVDAGIHFAVAAGNDNADSCSYSPAAADKAVTVGASTLADERAYFSNFGKCNDIFAPGLLAYLLSLQPSKGSGYAVADITPKKLKSNLISIATVGALTDVPSSTANILAWNGGGEGNFSSIVEKGSYQVSREQPEEKTISIDFGKIDDEVTVRTDKLAKKITEITGKIESEVAEELEAFFQSLKDE
ncbi:proteinase B [Friedmanniomyces endolithicus]|nr:proteinase B [Friedmanniomyces endolithicus]